MTPTQDTRDRILEKTWELFEAEGPARVRMADVARAAGVSRQAVYLHFGSRAGLLLGLVAFVDERQELGELIGWVRASRNGDELIQRLTRQQILYNPRIDALAHALQLAAPTDPDVQAAFDDRMEDRLRGMQDAAAQLRSWGELREGLSLRVAADLMWSILSLGVWRGLVQERGWTDEEYCEHIADSLRAVLLESGRKDEGEVS